MLDPVICTGMVENNDFRGIRIFEKSLFREIGFLERSTFSGNFRDKTIFERLAFWDFDFFGTVMNYSVFIDIKTIF